MTLHRDVYGYLWQTSGEPRSFLLVASPLMYPTPSPTYNMNAGQEEDPAPSIRFKRRKVVHTKRVNTNEDVPADTVESQTSAAAPPSDNAPDTPTMSRNENDSMPNLKDIIRNRRRPGDRAREAARKTDAPPRQQVATIETPCDGLYIGRFVAQTGQVVDRDDKQM